MVRKILNLFCFVVALFLFKDFCCVSVSRTTCVSGPFSERCVTNSYDTHGSDYYYDSPVIVRERPVYYSSSCSGDKVGSFVAGGLVGGFLGGLIGNKIGKNSKKCERNSRSYRRGNHSNYNNTSYGNNYSEDRLRGSSSRCDYKDKADAEFNSLLKKRRELEERIKFYEARLMELNRDLKDVQKKIKKAVSSSN